MHPRLTERRSAISARHAGPWVLSPTPPQPCRTRSQYVSLVVLQPVVLHLRPGCPSRRSLRRLADGRQRSNLLSGPCNCRRAPAWQVSSYVYAIYLHPLSHIHSTYHAGSNLPIAIDVSGNGKLSSAARLPGSGLPTSFDSLEIYLVSSQTNLNLTVSSGPGLLTQESGSTVKHLDFSISSCIPPGAYNVSSFQMAIIHMRLTHK